MTDKHTLVERDLAGQPLFWRCGHDRTEANTASGRCRECVRARGRRYDLNPKRRKVGYDRKKAQRAENPNSKAALTTRITALEAEKAELVERLHWREEALRHAQGRFLNINIALSSGGTKREAIGIADVGEDCCKMALAREELPVRIARATLAKHQEGEGNE